MTTTGNVASGSTSSVTSNAVSAVRGNSSKGGEKSSSGGFGDVLSDVQNGKSNDGEKSGTGAVESAKRPTSPAATSRGGLATGATTDNGDAARQFLFEIETALESAVVDGAAESKIDYQAAGSGTPQVPATGAAVELAAVIAAAQGSQAGGVAKTNGGEHVNADALPDANGRPGSQAAFARIVSVMSGNGGAAIAAGLGGKIEAGSEAVRTVAGAVPLNSRNTPGAPKPPASTSETDDSLFHTAAAEPQAVAESALEPRQTLRAQVVRQETHFPPVMPQAPEGDGVIDAAGAGTLEGVQPVIDELATAGMRPAQQVAERIGAGIAADATFARHLAGEADPATPKPVLKVLQIQLQPADMGTVTVRMELKNEGLMVHVEASRGETAELIRNDQETLSKLLRSAGYGIDATSIRVVEGDRSGASQQFSQQGGGQPQSQSSWQSQSGASEHQRQSGRGDTGDQAGNQGGQANRNESNETSAHRSSGGLYL